MRLAALTVCVGVFIQIRKIEAAKCPRGCSCDGSISMSCNELSKEESSEFLSALSSDGFKDLQSLTISSTSFIQLDHLPALGSLKSLIFENCSSISKNEEWNIERDKYFSLRVFAVRYSGLEQIFRSIVTAMPTLEELDLTGNKIVSLGSESLHLLRLRKLILRNNQIEGLGMHILRYLPQLMELDLSGNAMRKIVTSDFSSSATLRMINLSRNAIESIECDTSLQMLSLEALDLSGNKLRNIPGDALKNMEELVFLNLSGNPIEILRQAAIQLQNLQILDLSNTPVRVLEAGSLAFAPRLHTVSFAHSSQLSFVSPRVLGNTSLLFSLNLSHTGLKRISSDLLGKISRINLSGNRLDCACLLDELESMGTTTVVDWDDATCVTKRGAIVKLSDLSSSTLSSDEFCRPELILPFGTQISATIGQSFNIYCAAGEDEQIYWAVPKSDRDILAKDPEISDSQRKLDYFTSSLLEPTGAVMPIRQRRLATSEYFRFDVVLSSDEGDYECIAKRNGHSVRRKIKLTVNQPNITLNATHIGVTSVYLSWNKNLQVDAVDRVALQVLTHSGDDFKREVQLSLFNLYCSYNLISLIPDRAYVICLRWLLSDEKMLIYETCITERTKPIRSFYDTFGLETIIGLSCALLLLALYCCGSCLCAKLRILATAKRQSKLAQSVSGQSILSHSASNSDSVTYENFQLQSCASTAFLGNGTHRSRSNEKCQA